MRARGRRGGRRSLTHSACRLGGIAGCSHVPGSLDRGADFGMIRARRRETPTSSGFSLRAPFSTRRTRQASGHGRPRRASSLFAYTQPENGGSPMDRQTRRLAGFGLMFVLAASGCRSTRSEVPPGRQYSGDGRQVPPVGFSSDPHPAGAERHGIRAGRPGHDAGAIWHSRPRHAQLWHADGPRLRPPGPRAGRVRRGGPPLLRALDGSSPPSKRLRPTRSGSWASRGSLPARADLDGDEPLPCSGPSDLSSCSKTRISWRSASPRAC